MAYTAGRALLRLVVVVATAAVAGDIYDILLAMIVFEFMKTLGLAIGLRHAGLLCFAWDYRLLKEQLRFILPLGAAGLLFYANQQLSQFVVAAQLGAVALAVYTIGTYQLPLMAIVRSATSDALFPDMVNMLARGDSRGIGLWQRSTVLYLLIAIPTVVLLFTYADILVRTLFTGTYAAAAAVFQVSMFLMLRQCFDMGLPLRAQSKNRYLLLANVAGLLVQVPLVFVMLKLFGLVGAASAFLITDFLIAFYLFMQIMRIYDLSLAQLLPWAEIGRLAFAGVAPVPVLLVPHLNHVWAHGWAVLPIVAIIYLALYILIISRLKIPAVDMLRDKIARRPRRR